MKGYHPLAGGLLDDSSPLMWTKVNVQVRLVRCTSGLEWVVDLSMDQTNKLRGGWCRSVGPREQELMHTNMTAAGAEPPDHHARGRPGGTCGGRRGQHGLRGGGALSVGRSRWMAGLLTDIVSSPVPQFARGDSNASRELAPVRALLLSAVLCWMWMCVRTRERAGWQEVHGQRAKTALTDDAINGSSTRTAATRRCVWTGTPR